MPLSNYPSAVYDTSSSLSVVNSFEQAIVSAGSDGTAVGAFAIYAAQAGKRIVLREVTIANETAAACSVQFRTSEDDAVLRTVYVPAGMTQQFAFYVSSLAGETIERVVTAVFEDTEAIRIGYGIEIHAASRA